MGLSDDELLTHCLAFCSALTTHHRGEDDGMFAQLQGDHPDLAPTIAKLVQDHTMIDSIVTQVRDPAIRATESRGPTLEAISRELDGLAAIMESHFGYEERPISKALDGLAPDAVWHDAEWHDAVFRLGSASSRTP